MSGVLVANSHAVLPGALKGPALATATPSPSPSTVSSDFSSALPSWLLITLLSVVTLVIVATFALTAYSLSAPRNVLKILIGRKSRSPKSFNIWNLFGTRLLRQPADASQGSGTDQDPGPDLKPPEGTVTPQLIETLATSARSGRRTTRTNLAIVGFSLLAVVVVAIFGLSGQGVRDLRNQVIAAVTTLVATIAGFYFGADSVRGQGSQNGPSNSPPGLKPDPRDPGFVVGSPGSYSPILTGSPAATVILSQGALPQGLTLDRATGVIRGTPAAGSTGTHSVTLTASNGISPDAVLQVTLRVRDASAPGLEADRSNPGFVIGLPGTYTPVLTGAPPPKVTLSQGTLPAELRLDTATGVISGKPKADTAGTHSVTLTASNGITPDATLPVMLTISNSVAPSLGPGAASPEFTVGQPGSYAPVVTGTPAPKVTLSEGTLPIGLQLDTATGVISGTPATGAVGTYQLTLKAKNGIGKDATLKVTLTIKAG